MTEDLDLFSGKPQKKFSLKDFFNKCISHWPVFVLSMILCVGTGYVYLRYAVPKYYANTLILIKGTPANRNRGDLVETAVSGQLKTNFDFENELELLKSGSLLERVVLKNELNISYYHMGKVQLRDIYLDAPFRLIPQNITDSTSSISLYLNNLTIHGGNISFDPKKDGKKFTFRWNQAFKTGGKTFILSKKGNINNNNDTYVAVWSPVKSAAAEISARFLPGLLSKTADIIKLEILIENLNRGKDILNAIAREYNLSDIEERTIITRNTLRFIDDRLALMSGELTGVEGNLENYQGRNKIIDLTTQTSQSFGNANAVNSNLKEINIKQGVVQMIKNYFNNPASEDKLVPSTMGLEDATLTSLITKYNELQLVKQREAPNVAPNSTVMQDLNNQLNNVRGSILESLQNITKNLKLQENNFQQQNNQYNEFLSSLPRKERAMQEIKRKQSISEGLYLYLLQKREESAISSTSASVSNYKQIEPAKGGGPVEPNTTNVRLFSLILGLLLPFGFIFLKDTFNENIISREDFTYKVELPVLGDINHIPKKSSKEDLVVKNRDIIGEQFRIIRTNLSLLMKKKEKQVILITSSTTGEGKSFVSRNLAAVLSIPGKKVALLEFDLRKPEPVTNGSEKGIVGYLNGNTTDLSNFYTASSEIPSLHFYSSGSVTSNPGDLMLNDNIPTLFNILRQEYHYVIVDSAPVGLVSDAFILGEYSDVVVFIVRQRTTKKKQIDYLKEIVSAEKLNNTALIFNDVKTGGKYGYYGYGASYDGYGAYLENDKGKRDKKNGTAAY